MPSKQHMLDSLPRTFSEITLRPMTREDMDRFAEWPSYPLPYQALNLRFRKMPAEELDKECLIRRDSPDRLALVADHTDCPVVAYLSLVNADWKNGIVGSMGFRVEPAWCDRGIGTQVLRMLTDLCSDVGMKSVRLHVAASNPRAIRCYEKVGFIKKDEFWLDDEKLQGLDLSRTEYDFVRPHVRTDGLVPQLCFWLMEWQG